MIDTPATGLDERQQRLARLLADKGIELDLTSLHVMGDSLRIEGCVGSYSVKCAVEKAAALTGFKPIENCLRVVPGLATGQHSD